MPDLPQPADKAILSMVLSAAAAELFREDPDFLSAKAISDHPDSLLKSLDRLADGGWNYAELGDDALVVIARRFTERLAALGLTTVQARDFEGVRRLREQPPAEKPISRLLVLGFSSIHWPLWPTLEAASRLSSETIVCLRPPCNDSLGLDASWIGSWEGLLGPAEMPPPDALIQDRPTYRYGEAIWAPGPAQAAARAVSFTPATNLAAQARAAVRHAIAFLSRPGATRVGILVPGQGPLAREIIASLEAMQVPFWNDVGTIEPGFFESAAWKAVVAFHQTPTTDHFLAALGAGARLAGFPDLPREQIAQVLYKHRTAAFLDDFPSLAAHMADFGTGRSKTLGQFLSALLPIPDSGTFAELTRAFSGVLKTWGWDKAASFLFSEANLPAQVASLTVTRDAFLAYVTCRATSSTRGPGDFGNNFYAPLIVSTYKRADGLSWDFLVLTGLNEGTYPPPFTDSTFLGESTIFELNSKVRRLNAKSVRHLRDETMEVVPGKAMILGPVEERWATQQTFINALIETNHEAAALMSLHDETDGGDELQPSDFFAALFAADYGRAPTPDELRAAAQDFRASAAAPVIEDQVRHAFDTRRNPLLPIDEYSFSYRAEDPRQVRIGASGLEKTFSRPAETWLRGALRLHVRSEVQDMPWSLSIGEWCHAWLASAGGKPGAVRNNRSNGHFLASVEKAAADQLAQMAGFYAARSRELPRWWLAAHEKALCWSRLFANSLDSISVEAWPAFTCEISISENTGWSLPVGRIEFPIRCDIIFFDRAGSTVPELLAVKAKAWIIDYKSGANLPLSNKALDSGGGAQPALYALGLHDLGASDVSATLLKPGAELAAQLTLHDILQHQPLWEHLLLLQTTGRFGQLEAIRSDFVATATFPLATLPISQKTLRAKHRLTFPSLPA
jgi:hypothetical protein